MAMRIVAGSAGGIPLLCPRHGHVRPTMDQVRGAIFSSLADKVVDARVLDLFAGTGGLGIEALSRGARSTVFVEKDRRTLDYVRQNLVKTRLETGAETVCAEVFGYCARLARDARGPRFDLIFADPPYVGKDQPEDLASKLLQDANLAGLLAPEGVFVLEKSPKSPLSPGLNGWEAFRQKRYGAAEVLFLYRQETAVTAPDAASHPGET